MPYVPVHGTSLYYEETGPPGGRPLLLLHAALQTADSMEPLGRLLKPDGCRLIAPDQRGHGRSANPGRELSIGLLADDAEMLMAALGLEKPMVVGYSMGGSVGLELARRGRVSQLVVLASRFRPSLSGRRVFDPDSIRRRMPRWVDQLEQKHVETPWEELSRQVGLMFETWSGLSGAELAAIACPVLVIQGDKDEMVPVAEAQSLSHMIPGARLHVVPHARHPELLYRQDARKIVREFLAGAPP